MVHEDGDAAGVTGEQPGLVMFQSSMGMGIGAAPWSRQRQRAAEIPNIPFPMHAWAGHGGGVGALQGGVPGAVERRAQAGERRRPDARRAVRQGCAGGAAGAACEFVACQLLCDAVRCQ